MNITDASITFPIIFEDREHIIAITEYHLPDPASFGRLYNDPDDDGDLSWVALNFDGQPDYDLTDRISASLIDRFRLLGQAWKAVDQHVRESVDYHLECEAEQRYSEQHYLRY